HRSRGTLSARHRGPHDPARPFGVRCLRPAPGLPHAPPPHLFPYTTLFRSKRMVKWKFDPRPGSLINSIAPPIISHSCLAMLSSRSEEHTSELQSRENLVCRLLLEKKKHSV